MRTVKSLQLIIPVTAVVSLIAGFMLMQNALGITVLDLITFMIGFILFSGGVTVLFPTVEKEGEEDEKLSDG